MDTSLNKYLSIFIKIINIDTFIRYILIVYGRTTINSIAC